MSYRCSLRGCLNVVKNNLFYARFFDSAASRGNVAIRIPFGISEIIEYIAFANPEETLDFLSYKKIKN